MLRNVSCFTSENCGWNRNLERTLQDSCTISHSKDLKNWLFGICFADLISITLNIISSSVCVSYKKTRNICPHFYNCDIFAGFWIRTENISVHFSFVIFFLYSNMLHDWFLNHHYSDLFFSLEWYLTSVLQKNCKIRNHVAGFLQNLNPLITSRVFRVILRKWSMFLKRLTCKGIPNELYSELLKILKRTLKLLYVTSLMFGVCTTDSNIRKTIEIKQLANIVPCKIVNGADDYPGCPTLENLWNLHVILSLL